MFVVRRVLLIAWLFFATLTGAAAASYTVSGKVTDARDGSPLAGAVVSLEGLWAVSGEDGTFSVTKVQPGTYVLKASLLGYVDLEQSLNFIYILELMTSLRLRIK